MDFIGISLWDEIPMTAVRQFIQSLNHAMTRFLNPLDSAPRSRSTRRPWWLPSDRVGALPFAWHSLARSSARHVQGSPRDPSEYDRLAGAERELVVNGKRGSSQKIKRIENSHIWAAVARHDILCMAKRLKPRPNSGQKINRPVGPTVPHRPKTTW